MKSPLTALVVDDERLARRDLVAMLQDHPEVRVVGEADSVDSASQAISRLDPDLIFLDQVEPRGRVIFVTAYDQYALRAFEVNALDYLLKPVSPERLARALEKAPAADAETAQMRPLNYEDRLFLMVGNRHRFLRVGPIVSLHAAADYSELRLADGAKGLVLKALKEWEMRLPSRYFVRIHRSAIINLEYVDRVEEMRGASLKAHLKGAAEPLLISRRYAVRLKQQLG